MDKDTILHIISRGKRFAIVKSKSNKALKICQYREEAYYHARQISDNVIVHNTDGTILFSHLII